MKVLVAPNEKPRTEWTGKFTCVGAGTGGDGCGAILLVSEDDFFYGDRSVFASNPHHFAAFECGHCNKMNYVQTPFELEGKIPTEEEWRKKFVEL